MNLKNVICILWAVMSFPLYGADVSKDKQGGVETASLHWKIGISAFNKTVDNEDTGRKDKLTVHKAPLLLELQIPFGVKMKGLIQAGFGWIRTGHDKCEDEGTGLRISSEAGDTQITQFKKCTKWKEEKPVSTGYFMVQPGLQYDFGSFKGALIGGGFVNPEKEIGYMAGLFMRGVIVKGLDLGVEMLSYKDQNYFGISAKWGMNLKTWTRAE